MNEHFPGKAELSIVELHNRVLDQIRFEAIKMGGLTEEMIDQQFALYNYHDSSLKKDLLSAFRHIQYKGESVPEHPSNGFTKASAALKRERAYTEKLIAAQDIAHTLKNIHTNEILENSAEHSMNVEKQDLQSYKEESQQDKEQKIKDTYIDIPAQYQSDFRTQAADALRDSRKLFQDEKQTTESDIQKIKDWQKDTFQEMNQIEYDALERATDNLSEARSDFDQYKDTQEPTAEEWKSYSKEEQEAWAQKINTLVLSFKKDIV
jgi:hypothetical protein